MKTNPIQPKPRSQFLQELDSVYYKINDLNGVYMFPSVYDIFSDNIPKIAKYYFPIATIDLGTIDPKYNGLVHIVAVNRNSNCKEGLKLKSNQCSSSKTIFKIVEGKYNLMCNYEYFTSCGEYVESYGDDTKGFEEEKKKFARNERLMESEAIDRFNKSPSWLQGDEWPVDSNGEKLKFICQTDLAYYFSYRTEVIYLFYNHTEKKAVQVSQWD